MPRQPTCGTHDFFKVLEGHSKRMFGLYPSSAGYKLTFSECKFYAITDSERMTGFIGLPSNLIEMLFIDDSCRGKGYGSALIDFALKQGATKVDVNEQNVSALNFYQARGFRIIGRDETDEAGRPYPILHLSL